MKRYILKNINLGAYYRSSLGKGVFHYSFTKDQATILEKEKANSLLNQVKHKEHFKILELKDE